MIAGFAVVSGVVDASVLLETSFDATMRGCTTMPSNRVAPTR